MKSSFIHNDIHNVHSNLDCAIPAQLQAYIYVNEPKYVSVNLWRLPYIAGTFEKLQYNLQLTLSKFFLQLASQYIMPSSFICVSYRISVSQQLLHVRAGVGPSPAT